jgi:hypothetical protein
MVTSNEESQQLDVADIHHFPIQVEVSGGVSRIQGGGPTYRSELSGELRNNFLVFHPSKIHDDDNDFHTCENEIVNRC